MKITSASPVLQVADLQKSLNFYMDILGFAREFEFGNPAFYAGVGRDHNCFHLCAIPEKAALRGKGSVYLICDEVDKLHAELVSKGVTVTSPIADQPYGLRDFQIQDPDGNLISFGLIIWDQES